MLKNEKCTVEFILDYSGGEYAAVDYEVPVTLGEKGVLSPLGIGYLKCNTELLKLNSFAFRVAVSICSVFHDITQSGFPLLPSNQE